jgi:hypothetical protein
VTAVTPVHRLTASARINKSVNPKYATLWRDTSETCVGMGGSEILDATKIPAM